MASRMYISRVRLENIRGFSGPRNVDLTFTRPDGSHAGWTVLAGLNGSGKTSLLRAIALTVGGPVSTGRLVPDFRALMTVDAPAGIAEVRLVAGDEDYQPGDGPRYKDLALGLSWAVDQDRESSRPGSQPTMTGHSLIPSTAEALPVPISATPWQADPIGWFCAAYGAFRRLFGGSTEAQFLMSTPGPAARVASLFREDAALTEGVQWLVDKHHRALEGAHWADELKMAAMQLLADEMLPDNYEIADVNSDGLWVTNGGNRFPLREMSDGYRSGAALVVDLIKQFHDCYGELHFEVRDGIPMITAPGVVIIDEVDAHLHVTWQQRIGGWLKAHFPNVQFIVATHSPYICQAADPGGLIRLPGPGEEESPHVVDPALYQRVVYGSGDDAVLSELFGLKSPYSDQAEKLRQELVLLEARVIAGQASRAEITDYQELRGRLTSSPTARADEVAARLRLTHEQDG